jgi:hypothetical protein
MRIPYWKGKEGKERKKRNHLETKRPNPEPPKISSLF